LKFFETSQALIKYVGLSLAHSEQQKKYW